MAHHKSMRIVAPILNDKTARTPIALAAAIRAAFADTSVPQCVVDDWANEPRRRAYQRPMGWGGTRRYKRTPHKQQKRARIITRAAKVGRQFVKAFRRVFRMRQP